MHSIIQWLQRPYIDPVSYEDDAQMETEIVHVKPPKTRIKPTVYFPFTVMSEEKGPCIIQQGPLLPICKIH